MKARTILLAGAAVIIPQAAQAEEVANRDIIVTASPLTSDGDGIADARALRISQSASIAEQLARTTPGVSVNEIQGNPLQADINYHGFTASPLLGTPQGLSVYVDGVRVNQPFGDVVSWDLIPSSFIKSIDLIGGAAPQFGRNSLGGALAVETRDGLSDPGLSAEASYGSFDRLTANASIGGHADNGLNWFLAGDHFREDGWRE